jgi:hypothetical protein
MPTKQYYNTKYGIKNRKFIRRYKLMQGCADCSYKAHHAALEFDHLPNTGKPTSVGGMCYSASLKRIKEEIRKCDVVCSNCHSIRTYNRGQQVWKASPLE